MCNLDNEFYCTCCGNKLSYSIPRIRERPAGHLKKIYCSHCNKEINHVECKPFSKYNDTDFKLEYTYGNFDSNGDRKMPYGLFKDKLNKQGIDVHEFNEWRVI